MRRRACSRRPPRPTSRTGPSSSSSSTASSRYPGFVAGIEGLTGEPCGYRTEGTLWVALNRDQDGDLERLFSIQRAKGLAARRLTVEEALAREPHLSGRIVAALLAEGDHQVDPRALARALATALTRTRGTPSRRLPGDPDRGGRGAGRGRLRDGRGHRLPRPLPRSSSWPAGSGARTSTGRCPQLGLRPVKGQLVRLGGPELVRHVVRSPDVYLVPRRGGELLVGATMEEQGFDARPDGRGRSRPPAGGVAAPSRASTTSPWPSCRSASGRRCAITCR